jgi:hypothetical protein
MSYIGKQPTPVPLSTEDYQDGSVTGVKLAPNAAIVNLGFTPLNQAGGTVTGPLTVDGKITGGNGLEVTTGLTQVRALTVVGTQTSTGALNLTGNISISGTTLLGGDPTLALQAATKQYVDNNFQLATGVVTTLSGQVTLTAASARVIESTSVAEYSTVTLPDATTLTVSNGKFVFRNEDGNVFGIRNAAGQLLGAVGPNSTATVYLYNTATVAGTWSIVGDDVRPFFISNDGILPQSGTAASDTLATTDYALGIKIDTNRYVVIHKDTTATNNNVIAYAVDTSVFPAAVGARTVISSLSTGATVTTSPTAYAVDANTVFVFNGTGTNSFAVLRIVGTAITVFNSALTSPFATNPLSVQPVLSETQNVIQVAPDLYLFAFAASAATISYQAVKIDGTVARISTAVLSPQINGTGFAGFIDMRMISYNAGTGVGRVGVCHTVGTAAPYSLFVNRVTVTKNAAGAAPSLAAVDSVQATGATMPATFSFGFAVDQADPQFGVVYHLQNTTTFPCYNGITNLDTGTLTSTANSVIIARASTSFVRFAQTTSVVTAGMIGNDRSLGLEQYGPGAWRTYLTVAASTTLIKLSHVGPVYTATVADYAMPSGSNTVSGLAFVGGQCSYDIGAIPGQMGSYVSTSPTIVVMENSAMVPAAGQIGGAKLYVFNDEGNKLNLKRIVAPDTFGFRDQVPTLIGLQLYATKSGYMFIPATTATATTTNAGSFNSLAVFKISNTGNVRYYGTYQLPIKTVSEVFFNSHLSRFDDEIVMVDNAIEYDQALLIHYRKFLRMETAVQ